MVGQRTIDKTAGDPCHCISKLVRQYPENTNTGAGKRFVDRMRFGIYIEDREPTISGEHVKSTIVITLVVLCLVSSIMARPSVRIGRVITTNPNEDITLEISLENDSGFQSGGFNLVLDVSDYYEILNTEPGELLTGCEWEYFTFSVLPDNNLQITAIAETTNGPYHPDCFIGSSGTLAYITLSTDTTFSACELAPVRWKWFDCGDNAFSSILGDTLHLSHEVYDYTGFADTAIAKDTAFPTIYGAPEACMPNPRSLDFYNGGIWIVVNDNIPPVVQCRTDTSVYTDEGQCGAVVEFSVDGWDDCGGVELSSSPPSGTMFQVGTSPVFCLARDAVGNIDTCTFTITVIDTQAPQISCPPDTVVPNRPGICGAIVQFNPEIIDNCPGVSAWCTPSAGYNFPIGVTTVFCVATDAAGLTDTGSFTVTVEDIEPPEIVCPGDMLLENDSGMCGAYFSYTPSVTDNCAGVTYSMTPASGSVLSMGEYPVEIIATDAAGLADTCVFTVTVADTEPPVIACPDTISAAADSGVCGAIVDFSVEAEDNCASVAITYTPASGSLFPVGATPVTVIAVDTYGNADSCIFTVVVEDAVTPVISVPELVYAPADSGLCGAVMTFEITAEDNCGTPNITAEPPPGSYFDVGETTVLAIATDAAGNSDSSLFTVFVYDTQPPAVTCPENIAVQSDSGHYGAMVSFPYDAYDNCDSVYAVAEPASGSLFPAGISEVSVIGIDAENNRDTCRFTVTVTLVDADSDNIPDWDDNCPADYNPGQLDSDNDGIGDICDWRLGDANGDEEYNVGDVVFLIAYVFNGGPAPQPLAAGDANCDGEPNIGDAVYLINYIFNSGSPPVCP